MNDIKCTVSVFECTDKFRRMIDNGVSVYF